MLVNHTIEFNHVTIWDVNLLQSANYIFEKFAGYNIFLLIKFFYDNNQLKLNKKYRNLTTFILFFRFIYMITLAQDITNLASSFIKIVFKILTLYL